MLTFEQAMQAAKSGKFLRLIDDGRGFQLPGILYALPPELLHVIAGIAIENTNKTLSAAQLALVNVFNNGENTVAMRFYTSAQFSSDSIWTIATDIDSDASTDSTIVLPIQATNTTIKS